MYSLSYVSSVFSISQKNLSCKSISYSLSDIETTSFKYICDFKILNINLHTLYNSSVYLSLLFLYSRKFRNGAKNLESSRLSYAYVEKKNLPEKKKKILYSRFIFITRRMFLSRRSQTPVQISSPNPPPRSAISIRFFSIASVEPKNWNLSLFAETRVSICARQIDIVRRNVRIEATES